MLSLAGSNKNCEKLMEFFIGDIGGWSGGGEKNLVSMKKKEEEEDKEGEDQSCIMSIFLHRYKF